MADSITVSPAYGRDYSHKEAACEAWFAGKDFMCVTADGKPVGRYCSCRDFPHTTEVIICYGKKRKKVIITQMDQEI